MSRPFHFVVVPARGPVTHVALGATTMRIGSSPAAEIHIPDPELAPVHARLEPRDGGHVLVRMAGPLLVNGRRVKAHLLAAYDLIVLGKNALAYRPGAPAEAGAATGASGLDALRRLHRFAERVARREDVGALAEQLLGDIVEIVGASRGTLVRLLPDDDPAAIATTQRGAFEGSEIAFSRTLLRRMNGEARTVFVPDTRADPAAPYAASLASAACSAIAAPVCVDGRVLGAIYVSAAVGTIGEAEVELVELYASHAASIFAREQRAASLEARLSALGEPAEDGESHLVGGAPAMIALRRAIRKAAPSRAPVLVVGETGTGKELVAREIHRLSPRARGPFIALNCGAVAHELLESELFGHVRGAFTNAQRDRAGYFRSADGGTLFLDEIGEMPLAQQVALLRALEEGAVTPVGADKPEAVDVRVVCATNRVLADEIAHGRFRQDLYFRLAVVTLNLPPLRERPEDIVRLAEHFLRREAHEVGAPGLYLSDDALVALRRAAWPGNVRELEASIRRAVVMREGDVIDAADLGLPPPGQTGASTVRPLAMARDEFLRGYVRDVVDRLGGNRTAAAEALLVTPRTVFKYLEE